MTETQGNDAEKTQQNRNNENGWITVSRGLIILPSTFYPGFRIEYFLLKHCTLFAFGVCHLRSRFIWKFFIKPKPFNDIVTVIITVIITIIISIIMLN